MIKLMMLCKRLPHLTWEEFDHYWREIHGPLVVKNSAVLGTKRYVQLPMLNPALQKQLQNKRQTTPLEFDGIAEAYYNDLDDLKASMSIDNEEARAARQELIEDEKKFIDMANSQIILCEVREVIK